MKFSDNIQRKSLDSVFVKRSESDMMSRDEFSSNFWDVEIYNISFDKESNSAVHLYSTPCRDVRISESIYDNKGSFVAYRSE